MGDECCNAAGSVDASKSSSSSVAVNKAEYVGNMECKLAEIGAKIDDLGAKACDARKEKIEELKKRREEAMIKVHEVKEVSCEAFHEFKGGCDKAFEALSLAWEEICAGSEKAVAKLAETTK